MKFNLKRLGNKIDAISQDGEVLATWEMTTKNVARGNSSYDLHRRAKGDNFDVEYTYNFTGRHEELLNLIQAQIPAAFVEAKWQLRMVREDDLWAVVEFLKGLSGGCAWYGNTPKNVIKKVERAQAKLSFEL